MVNHILSMQKTPKLNCEWLDLIASFEEISNLFRNIATSQDLSFHLDIDYSELSEAPYIRTDQQKLHEVLINLLGNAIKFNTS